MSPSSRRALGILATIALFAGLLSSVLVRVPRGSVLLSAGRTQASGWRLAPVVSVPPMEFGRLARRWNRTKFFFRLFHLASNKIAVL